MSESRLVVITGPDGSGKSSLIAELVRGLNQKNGEGFARSSSVWDSMLAFKEFKKSDVEKYLGGLSNPARALFIFHALADSMKMAQSENARVIFSDGYFYKYAASELAYGVDAPSVYGACVSFARPDLCFYLEVSSEEASARKEKITQYEGGVTFLDFQKKVALHWAELEKKYGPWIHLASTTSVEERIRKILPKIEELLS